MMGRKSMIHDLTEGSVTRTLLVFSSPLMLSNLLQTLYNMVDMVVIGQFVGSAGLSAVSIGGDVLHLLTFLVMGFSNAGQVILSQIIGASRRDRVMAAIGTIFTVILLSAVILTVLFWIFLNPMLSLLNTPPESFVYAHQYCLTCILGLIFIYGYNMVSAILRGLGDSQRPLMFIAVATAVNLILDLVFVALFGLGAFGAALATVIGQGVSFVWAIIYLYRRREGFGFDFRPASFRPDREILGQLIKLGLPMALQMASISISMLVLSSFINAYGVIASAVTGVGNKLASVSSVVSQGISTAGSSMVGQSLGAQKYDRVPRIFGMSYVINLIFAFLLALVTVCFPRFIFGLFNSDPEVLDMAMSYVPVAVLLYIGYALRSPCNGLINGSGNAGLNLANALLDGVVGRIGLGLLMGLALNMGIMGFWLGNAFAGYVPFLVGMVYFLSGRWRTRLGR